MAGAVDIHGHLLDAAYLELLEKHDALFEDGFPLPSWDAAEAVSFMDEAGIDLQVLSLSSPQPHFGDDAESIAFCTAFNDWTADAVAAHPGRFAFAATLPLPCVDAACTEAERAMRELGAVGVALPSNARGLYLGDPALDPLMEVLDELGAVAIIHPHKPAALTEGLFTSGPVPLYEFLADTTRAVLNMLARDIPVRYPGVRFVVPHSGSFLPPVAGRIAAIQPFLTARGMMPDADLAGGLARLYFDLAGAPTPQMLELLLSIAAPDHVLYGSDYPFTNTEIALGAKERLEKMLLSSPHRDAIMRENALALLGFS